MANNRYDPDEYSARRPDDRRPDEYCHDDHYDDHHHDCCKHIVCPAGPTGPRGPIGPIGATGPSGATGSSGTGAIIPFASGTIPASTTTALGGVAGVPALLGFGTNGNAVIAAGVINTSGLNSFAFSMPRDGFITSIAAYFSIAAAVTLTGTTFTVTARIYSAPTPNDSFAPIPGASVILSPALAAPLAIGTITSGETTGLFIPVTAGTRLLFVLSTSVTAGTDVATTVTGFASGGLGIA